jgi:hypothetical protein
VNRRHSMPAIAEGVSAAASDPERARRVGFAALPLVFEVAPDGVAVPWGERARMLTGRGASVPGADRRVMVRPTADALLYGRSAARAAEAAERAVSARAVPSDLGADTRAAGQALGREGALQLQPRSRGGGGSGVHAGSPSHRVSQAALLVDRAARKSTPLIPQHQQLAHGGSSSSREVLGLPVVSLPQEGALSPRSSGGHAGGVLWSGPLSPRQQQQQQGVMPLPMHPATLGELPDQATTSAAAAGLDGASSQDVVLPNSCFRSLASPSGASAGFPVRASWSSGHGVMALLSAAENFSQHRPGGQRPFLGARTPLEEAALLDLLPSAVRRLQVEWMGRGLVSLCLGASSFAGVVKQWQPCADANWPGPTSCWLWLWSSRFAVAAAGRLSPWVAARPFRRQERRVEP